MADGCGRLSERYCRAPTSPTNRLSTANTPLDYDETAANCSMYSSNIRCTSDSSRGSALHIPQ